MTFPSLDALEQRVDQAGERFGSLRDEIAQLKARVAELERELDSARGEGERTWAKERDQLRRRVEKLAGRLGALLEA